MNARQAPSAAYNAHAMTRLAHARLRLARTALIVTTAVIASTIGDVNAMLAGRARASTVASASQVTQKPPSKPTSKPSPQKPTAKPATPKPAPTPVATSTAPSPIIGSCNYSPIVADLERAIVFYRRVIGLEVPPAGENGRPFDSTTPVLDMLGVRGAEMRWVTARIPASRCGVELVEFGKLDRTPLETRPQDPGATTLVLVVRDIEPIFSRALNASVPIVTTGGVPMTVASEGGAAILLREPDGHFVEVVQPKSLPKNEAPPSANIIGWHVRQAVGSTDEALRLYRDQFGLEVKSSALARNQTFTALNGLPDVPVRLTSVNLPGGGRLELAEYGGGERKPLGARIQDPGATRFQLQVRDVSNAIELAKKAGATVISQDGAIIDLPGDTKASVARDPNNLFLVIFSTPTP